MIARSAALPQDQIPCLNRHDPRALSHLTPPIVSAPIPPGLAAFAGPEMRQLYRLR